MRDGHLFVVVAYDIADDRRRLRIMKLLKGYGEHIQESVFECHLRHSVYGEMLKRLRKLMSKEQDNIRLYHLCRTDVERIQELGMGRSVQLEEEFRIV